MLVVYTKNIYFSDLFETLKYYYFLILKNKGLEWAHVPNVLFVKHVQILAAAFTDNRLRKEGGHLKQQRGEGKSGEEAAAGKL
jgi:galactose-1-phosphate uridylyltransferase